MIHPYVNANVMSRSLNRALQYLSNVRQHKEIVPVRRYTRGVGRKAQVCLIRNSKLVRNESSQSTSIKIIKSGSSFLKEYEVHTMIYFAYQCSSTSVQSRSCFLSSCYCRLSMISYLLQIFFFIWKLSFACLVSVFLSFFLSFFLASIWKNCRCTL